SGGCGKTFTLNVLIKKLYAKYGKTQIGVTSSTGLSALNIGGITLHSYTNIGIMDKSFEEIIKFIKENNFYYNRWINTKILIIDEISMINSDTFDFIDQIAREIRKNKKPFGGIQLVLSGDFLQLKPVKGNYAFESKVWELVVEKYVMLKTPYRQKDKYFIDGLNKMRFGEIDSEFYDYIIRLARPIKYNDGEEPTKLFATVNEVEICNRNKLNDLSGKNLLFEAEEWSVAKNNNSRNQKPTHEELIEWLDKSTLSETRINLKIGAQ
ncbi:21955_t:CDS:1, partial [Cetraspora pellucida]